MSDPEHPHVDPERPRTGNPFDNEDHFTGEDYDLGREQALGRERPSGLEDVVAGGGDPQHPGGRAHFDAKTGEVHEIGLPEDEDTAG